MAEDLSSIGYCGVDCGACPDYASGKCAGCRASVSHSDKDCFFVQCCGGNRAQHCGACINFPCTDMIEFAEESDSHRAAFERLGELRMNAFLSDDETC